MRGKEAREVHALLMCSEEEYDEALEMEKRMATGDLPTTTNSNKKKQIMLAADALQYFLPTPEEPRHIPFYHQSVMSAPGPTQKYTRRVGDHSHPPNTLRPRTFPSLE